ncbi:hypothetical protein [Dysgonomonas sp. 511]|uniref:hypothetical protein n=1 Tax=Dysgonomonas sp. 511 TaxID=2302930 RepID=UPI0013CF8DA7|nr:hypothetical protein [Dysgonomonas sp. 511]NDV80162.1 hypothetical protein [Dysgonomonas sp. 511]
MKKLFYILLLFCVPFVFPACGGDDDDDKIFQWEGDWNDPEHPMYQVYGGNYNPVKGVWVHPNNEEGGYFSEDFKYYSIVFLPNGTYQKITSGTDYQINNTTIRYFSRSESYQYYRLEKNWLYVNYQYLGLPISDDNWGKYERWINDNN